VGVDDLADPRDIVNGGGADHDAAIIARASTRFENDFDLDEVQIWDLLSAFDKLMKDIGGRKKFHEVTYDDTPIDLHAADIEDRLTREGKLTLSQLVVGRKSRSEMIGVFLALLELIREKKILVTQPETLGDVEIVPAPEEHRKQFAHASLHLADELEEKAAEGELTTESEAPSEEPAT
jgi:segregation and condensation protein A